MAPFAARRSGRNSVHGHWRSARSRTRSDHWIGNDRQASVGCPAPATLGKCSGARKEKSADIAILFASPTMTIGWSPHARSHAWFAGVRPGRFDARRYEAVVLDFVNPERVRGSFQGSRGEAGLIKTQHVEFASGGGELDDLTEGGTREALLIRLRHVANVIPTLVHAFFACNPFVCLDRWNCGETFGDVGSRPCGKRRTVRNEPSILACPRQVRSGSNWLSAL